MEQRSSSVATMQRTKGVASLSRNTEMRPAGIGSTAGPTLGVVPGRRLGRQATLAKGLRFMMQPPAALPLFDMSVAVIDSLNLMRASMEEEVVLQSTLAVPAHQALACRIEAYGSPFAAPTLQAVQGELSEADKQFAACLAAPPDFDAAGAMDPTFSLQRMASLGVLGQQQQAHQASATQQQAAQRAAPELSAVKGTATGKTGELLRMPSIRDQKKEKKAEGLRGLEPSGADPLAAAASGSGDGAMPSVSTPEGRAAIAALAREAQLHTQWQRRLFDGCRDPVAALVGTGYLLLRAAGFSARAPRAVEGFAGGLRRLASIAPQARNGGALPWGASVALAPAGGGGGGSGA